MTAGQIFHVFNRANDRMRLFHDASDYDQFIELMRRAKERYPVRIYAFCVMPNHFHAVVEPRAEGALSGFMRWWMTTHACRYQLRSPSVGHLWQGRYKGLAVRRDEHLLAVMRYVLQNPVRAGLTQFVERWRWSSARSLEWVDAPPLPLPDDWTRALNRPLLGRELEGIRESLSPRHNRGQSPLGTVPSYSDSSAPEVAWRQEAIQPNSSRPSPLSSSQRPVAGS